jgi:diguanylate cyclase
MSNFEREDQLGLRAERLLQTLRDPIQLEGIEKTISASVGIATFNSTLDETFDLLKCADIAMYQAKQAGRDQYRYFSRELHEKVQLRVALRSDLEKALAAQEFVVYYQPKFRALDGRLSGMEALLRWRHPTKGLLTPDAFLDIAEETGLIVDIGRWVLREGCRQLKVWQTRYSEQHPQLGLAVNLSAVQISQKSLSKTVADALEETEVIAVDLELEITESVLIADTHETVSTLSAISAMGIALSLDDFGTGYSSMAHLNRYPISVLKIDKSFLGAIGGKGKGEKLLAAMISFAKTLEITVVAEGVETQEQADFCLQRGCDYLQGYYFSKPIGAEDFESKFLTCS